MAVCALVVATLGVGLVAEVWVSRSSAGPSVAPSADLAGAAAANPSHPGHRADRPAAPVDAQYLQRRDVMAEAAAATDDRARPGVQGGQAAGAGPRGRP